MHPPRFAAFDRNATIFIFIVFAQVIFTIASLNVNAARIFVSQNGVDKTDCGEEQRPCQSLEFSLQHRTDRIGDELMLFDGEYAVDLDTIDTKSFFSSSNQRLVISAYSSLGNSAPQHPSVTLVPKNVNNTSPFFELCSAASNQQLELHGLALHNFSAIARTTGPYMSCNVSLFGVEIAYSRDISINLQSISGSLVIQDSVFRDHANDDKSCIRVFSNSSLSQYQIQIQRSTFKHNVFWTAYGRTSVLQVYATASSSVTVAIASSSFFANKASTGRAQISSPCFTIGASQDSVATVSIDGTYFVQNSGDGANLASAGCGHIVASSGATVVASLVDTHFANSSITSLVGNSFGGALFVESNSGATVRLSVSDSSFVLNKAVTGEAGGMSASGSSISVSVDKDSFFNGTFQGTHFNSSRSIGYALCRGAVHFVNKGTSGIRFEDCVFSQNSVDTASTNACSIGAALNSVAYDKSVSELQCNRCRFVSNSVRGFQQFGGAIAIVANEENKRQTLESGHVSFVDSVFQDNSAVYTGPASSASPTTTVGGAALYSTTLFSYMFVRCTFTGNTARRGSGGALQIQNAVDISVRDSSFVRNHAFDYAGALAATWGGTMAVSNTVFRENSVIIGIGAAAFIERMGTSSFAFCDFIENVCEQGQGGALAFSAVQQINAVQRRSSVTGASVRNCLFDGNKASDAGGAIVTMNMVILDIKDSILRDNSADLGGAVAILGASMRTFGSIYGAALTISAGVVVKNCTLEYNSAITGGALYIPSRLVIADIQHSKFWRNSASFGGGGSILFSGRSLRVFGSTFEEDASFGEGGCVQLSGQDILIDQCKFIGCEAVNGGGGIAILAHSISTMIRSTSVVNSKSESGHGGGILCFRTDSCALKNTHLENNIAPQGCGGGLACIGSSCNMIDAHMVLNQAMDGGGACFNPDDKPLYSTPFFSVLAGKFEQNVATIDGGGILIMSQNLGLWGTAVAISSAGFTSNRAKFGGAIAFSRLILERNLEKFVMLAAVAFTNNSALAGGTFYAGNHHTIPQYWIEGVKTTKALAYGPLIASNPCKLVSNESTVTVGAGSSVASLDLRVFDNHGNAVTRYETSRTIEHPSFWISINNTFGNELLVKAPEKIEVDSFAEGRVTLDAVQLFASRSALVSEGRDASGSLSFQLYSSTQDLYRPAKIVGSIGISISVPQCDSGRRESAFLLRSGDDSKFVECRRSYCPNIALNDDYQAANFIMNIIGSALCALSCIVCLVAALIAFARRIKGMYKHWRLRISILASCFTSGILLLVIMVFGAVNNKPGGSVYHFLQWPLELPLTDFSEVVYICQAILFYNSLAQCFLVSLFMVESSSLATSYLDRSIVRRGKTTVFAIRDFLYGIAFLVFTLAVIVSASIAGPLYWSQVAQQVVMSLIVVLAGVPTLVMTFMYATRTAMLKLWAQTEDEEFDDFDDEMPKKRRSKVFAFARTVFSALMQVLLRPFLILQTSFGLLLLILIVHLSSTCKEMVFLIGNLFILVCSIVTPFAILNLKTLPLPRFTISENEASDQDMYLALDDPAKILELIPEGMQVEASSLQFIRELGQGAQGVVLLAELHGGTQVAVKTVATHVFGTAADLSGFLDEMQLLANFGFHPNIVRFVGVTYDTQRSRLGLVLEYCENGSLADLLEQCRHSQHRQKPNGSSTRSDSSGGEAVATEGTRYRLNFAQKIKILQGIAAGMQFLHSRKLIHRDLKAENVLIDGAMVPKLADFGLARRVQENQNMTMQVGTGSYLSPETLRAATRGTGDGSGTSIELSNSSSGADEDRIGSGGGRGLLSPIISRRSRRSNRSLAKYDHRSDIYSFGILMHVLLTENIRPYGSTNDLEIIMQVARNKTYRPSLDDIMIHQAIENNNRWYIDLMQKCWSFDPDERPQSFDAILRVIKNKIE